MFIFVILLNQSAVLPGKISPKSVNKYLHIREIWAIYILGKSRLQASVACAVDPKRGPARKRGIRD
jgi:hypothetical protein